MKSTIDQLIINSPYKKPEKYWSYDREARLFDLKDGRRPAGYVVASEKSKAFDDPGIFVEIPLVNMIRPRVDAKKARHLRTGIPHPLYRYLTEYPA
jgi:type III restriction enzyme